METAKNVKMTDEEMVGKFLDFLRIIFMPKDQSDMDEEDVQRAELLAKVVMLLVKNLIEHGEKGAQPIFYLPVFVKPMTGGVSRIDYSLLSIGGEPFGKFNLTLLAQKLQEGMAEWNVESWGGELTEKGVEMFEQWGDVLDDISKAG